MKHHIKPLLFLSLLVTIIAIGCGENANEKIEKEVDSIAMKLERGIENITDVKNPDERFLSDAMEANVMELDALELGKTKGGKEVRTQAAKMMADHKKLDKQMNDIITRKNITLTDLDTSNLNSNLRNMTAGKAFDKAWVDKMVNDHEKMVSMFEDARDDVQDSTLKSLITSTLPELKTHQEKYLQLKEKMNK